MESTAVYLTPDFSYKTSIYELNLTYQKDGLYEKKSTV